MALQRKNSIINVDYYKFVSYGEIKFMTLG